MKHFVKTKKITVAFFIAGFAFKAWAVWEAKDPDHYGAPRSLTSTQLHAFQQLPVGEHTTEFTIRGTNVPFQITIGERLASGHSFIEPQDIPRQPLSVSGQIQEDGLTPIKITFSYGYLHSIVHLWANLTPQHLRHCPIFKREITPQTQVQDLYFNERKFLSSMIIAKQASQPFYKHRQQITENRDCSLKEGLMEELAQKIQFGRISVASLATFPQYSIPNTETTHNMGTWSETMRKSGRILHPREILRSTGDQIFDDAANILYGHLSIVDFLDRPTLTPAHRSAVMTHPLFIQWTNEAMELSRTLQWD